MLFLLIELDREQYALDVQQIVEVLPLVRIRRIPHAPPGIAGVFDYRGAAIPAVDLSELMLGRPSASRLSTRLVVVRHGDDGGRVLGLIAERATDTIRKDPSEFVASGIDNRGARYLGPVTSHKKGVVQWIRVTDLLPEGIEGALLSSTVEVP